MDYSDEGCAWWTTIRRERNTRPTFDCSLIESEGVVIQLRDGNNKDATDAEQGQYEKKQRPKLKQEQKRISEVKKEQEEDVDTHVDNRRIRVIPI